MRNGETERKDGRYVYRYTDQKTGKRKNIYAKDLPELREKEKAVNADINDNIRTDGNLKKLTVNSLFQNYLETKEISESTLAGYRSTWKNHVEDSIGQYKAVNVLPSDIKKLYSGLSQKGLAKNSIRRIHNLIRPALEMAVDDGIIRRNPAKSVWKDYGREPEEKKALTVGQQKQLMEFVKSDSRYKRYYPMLTVMLGTGVRCGELVGLTWDDVDMGKKEIHIRHTLIYKNFGNGMEYRISTPKTKSGIRTIPMSDKVYNAFIQQKQLNAMSGKDRNSFEVGGCRDFIFITRTGRPFLMTSVNKLLAHIASAMDMENPGNPFPSISAHTMRHTFCTRMAENRMDIKVLQKVMGHANVTITMQTYTHVADSSRIRDEFDRIDELAVDF